MSSFIVTCSNTFAIPPEHVGGVCVDKVVYSRVAAFLLFVAPGYKVNFLADNSKLDNTRRTQESISMIMIKEESFNMPHRD
jgi:hypothetical protein